MLSPLQTPSNHTLTTVRYGPTGMPDRLDVAGRDGAVLGSTGSGRISIDQSQPEPDRTTGPSLSISNSLRTFIDMHGGRTTWCYRDLLRHLPHHPPQSQTSTNSPHSASYRIAWPESSLALTLHCHAYSSIMLVLVSHAVLVHLYHYASVLPFTSLRPPHELVFVPLT